MSKKILALLLALVMMLSLLTACGGSTGRRDKHAAINQDTDVIATEPPDDTKATITVATWDGGIGSQWLEQAAKAFEEKYADATHFEEGKVGVDVIIKASRSYDGSAIHLTPLKTDPEQYELLKARIMKEYLSNIYLKMSLYKNAYSESEIEEMRQIWNEYIAYWNITKGGEGNGLTNIFA